MDQNVKKEIISRIFSIVTTSLFLIVTTWFWFGPRVELAEARTLAAGQMASGNLELVDLSEPIKLENAYPMTDAQGSAMEPYRFEVINHDDQEVSFTIAFVNDVLTIEQEDCQVLGNNYLRYTIEKDGAITPARNLALSGDMYMDTLGPNETATYALRFWIDQNAGNEIMGTHFHAKVAVILENNK